VIFFFCQKFNAFFSCFSIIALTIFHVRNTIDNSSGEIIFFHSYEQDEMYINISLHAIKKKTYLNKKTHYLNIM
jgi:hypothetical protein